MHSDCTSSTDITIIDTLKKLAADNNTNNTITIVLGTLPIVLTFVGLLIAYLQLRRTRLVVDLESLRPRSRHINQPDNDEDAVELS